MPTITAVVTSHANVRGLRSILGNLHYQTRHPDETLCFVSGISRAEFCRLAEEFPWVQFFFEDDLADWGHAKRSAGVERATREYVGFFNDDDSYSLDYIERMLEPRADAVYCAWNEQPECVFSSGSSTSGNFIVRSEIAKKIGYPSDAVYENDGVFINRINNHAKSIVKVNDILYTHNG